MDKAEIDKLRKEMIRQQAELREEEGALHEATLPVALDQASVGRLTRMNEMQTQQMALENSRRHQEQLAELAGALKRIEAGNFGSCFVCGEDIDPRRLSVVPTSTRFLKCAEA